MKRRKGEKERARRKKGGEEKKAMAAPFFFFIMATLEIVFGRKKKLLDAKGPFGGDVFKNMYGKLELKNWV